MTGDKDLPKLAGLQEGISQNPNRSGVEKSLRFLQSDERSRPSFFGRLKQVQEHLG